MDRPGADALEIGGARTTIGERALAIGWETLARAHFKHEPPTPLEIENAIAAIEDEIARADLPRGLRVASRDAVVRDIATQTPLAREAVENAFERSLRHPPPNERMAALLILRELMHHLDIASIDVPARA